MSKIYKCDFCGKTEKEASLIIAGKDDTGICGDCVWLCVDIITDWVNRHKSVDDDNKQVMADGE